MVSRLALCKPTMPKPPDLKSVRHQLAVALTKLDQLRRENAELRRELGLGQHAESTVAAEFTDRDEKRPGSTLSTTEKVALFRKLFRGRTDIFPLRWENKAGKSGYAPACGNEWRAGICEKPRVKCSDCPHQMFLPVTDQVIFDHLAGRHIAGVYPLLADDSCHFLAVDFDDADWRADAIAFCDSCDEFGIAAHIEISRSGKGAHVWIFFTSAIAASLARQLGTALITHTCAQARLLKLTSYDRLFPSQDTLPKGGFGNLIALPLQKKPRDQNCSVFVDRKLRSHPDQWGYLAGADRVAPGHAAEVVGRIGKDGNLLDVAFIADEDEREPWRSKPKSAVELPAPLPKSLTITLANQLYFEKAELPNALSNRLIRLAAFQNPEFYAAQSMRMPIWNKPRVIGCAENFAQHIALPRGCLDDVLDLLRANGIKPVLRDERTGGESIVAVFSGVLREEQKIAVSALLKNDIGILCAPTAFGKTVTAAAIIAKRGINTLVLVHRTELLNQWQERLRSFLELDEQGIGALGGGKRKPSGKIDVAVMQSLVRKGEVKELVETYGQVIVDECHHVSALSFEQILRRVKARYVLGLTATPIRRDGHHPIVTMQCGSIRHQVARSEQIQPSLEVLPRVIAASAAVATDQIQALFAGISEDDMRNKIIVADVTAAYKAGRHVMVMSERTEHVERLAGLLRADMPNLFVLHGRMGKRQRQETLERLNGLRDDEPRALLATGKLIGEGFDHARLDTMVLAMPISWKGTLQQYAGRLHRQHEMKTSVMIYDYVDAAHSQLVRMWEKRKRGYRAMGYEIRSTDRPQLDWIGRELTIAPKIGPTPE
jgi:superfamily II DNA or RNA helicase